MRQDLNHVMEEVGVLKGSVQVTCLLNHSIVLMLSFEFEQYSTYRYKSLLSEMEIVKQSLKKSQVIINYHLLPYS